MNTTMNMGEQASLVQDMDSYPQEYILNSVIAG